MLRLVNCFSFGLSTIAQTVHMPRAQAVVDELMARHPEMQTIGLHITPHGWTDNLNVAGSKPGKIGKLSADIDLEVIRTGKPSLRRTVKGAFDMGLPLTDSTGQTWGMVVIVIRETFTNSPIAALVRAAAIRDELQAKLPNLAAVLEGAALRKSMAAMIAQTPMPDVVGNFGHFAAAPSENRLYLTAQDNHSIEVFDLEGEHMQTMSIRVEPRSLAFDRAGGHLLVIDASNDSRKVLDAKDLHLVEQIALPPGANSSVFDPDSRTLFAGSGDSVTVISAINMKIASQIALPSLDVQAMAYDPKSGRLYVNLRDKGQVAVVSLPQGKIESLWTLPGIGQNTAMAVNPSASRLFVAGRNPAKLAVVDTESGSVLQTLDTVEGADDLAFDAERNRLYLTGAGGLAIYFFADGRYSLDSQFPIMQSKTSFYVAERRQLYAADGKNQEDGAALQVYKVR